MAIRLLPPQLANQIAAGEVVERPSSVIKELVENSIDAGATRIDIDVEQGGCKLIRIRDNGAGIDKDELALALTRHATSKIADLDDLSAIMSLGFRGEALASISSVARLTLTSRTAQQNEAWQVYAEGRDMQTTIKPAAHPVGTTVEVLDLFYNTPARRRFLRTDKTEFAHIDETVRRIALASPLVAITLQHNGKLIKQYRAISELSQLSCRVTAICGAHFMQKAVKLEWQHDDLQIYGWVNEQAGSEYQYFYVNNRVIKDRLLNHAIRQAYSHLTDVDKIAYIIYLHIDPQQVDVNVHPAKHEVRFHEARLVHDFVYQAVLMALDARAKQSEQTALFAEDKPALDARPANRVAAGSNIFTYPASVHSAAPHREHALREPDKRAAVHQQRENQLYQQLLERSSDTKLSTPTTPVLPVPAASDARETGQAAAMQALFPVRDTPLVLSDIISDSGAVRELKLGKVLTIYRQHYAVLQHNDELQLLSLPLAQRSVYQAKLLRSTAADAEALLLPINVLFSHAEIAVWQQLTEVWQQLNIGFTTDKHKLQLQAVPRLLRNMNWQQVLPSLVQLVIQHEAVTKMTAGDIADWLATQYQRFSQLNRPQTVWTQTQAISLMTDLEQLTGGELNLEHCLQPIALTQLLDFFEAK